MTTVKATINPSLLEWARKTAHRTIEEASKRVGVEPDRLLAWEQGADQPTINQLRTLADYYRRPLASFYLADIPREFSMMKDFRQVAEAEAGAFSAELSFQIRSAYQRREVALELMEEAGEQPESFEAGARLAENTDEVGARVRGLLSVTDAEQSEWHDNNLAFNTWRQRLEDRGVLVFQISRVEFSEIRGFSIAAPILPVIGVNSKDSYAGRTFSMMHELTHVLLRNAGACDFNETLKGRPEDRQVEVFCNAVAAAILVPADKLLSDDLVLQRRARSSDWPDNDIERLARRFSVSREAIVRRLLTLNMTTEAFYRQKRQQYINEQIEAAQRKKDAKKSGGPTPDKVAVSSMGRPFIRLVLSSYYQDRLTLSDVANYLGVRLKHLPKIEEAIARRF